MSDEFARSPSVNRQHNKPPIEAPTPVDAQADVRERYPDVEKRAEELLASAKQVPERIEDEATAKDVQTLLRSMTETMGGWKSLRTNEKGPWQKVADTVYAFFTTPLEKVKKSHDDIKARYTAYQEIVREKERQAREERAQKERDEAARLQKEAEEARERREKAEADERAAREREAEAQRKAAEAEQRRIDADAAAARAKAEAERIAREKKDRDDRERRVLMDNLSMLRRQATLIEQFIGKEIAGKIEEDELVRLEDLLSPHGSMAQMAAPILRGLDLLDETQQAGFKLIRERRSLLIAERDKRIADHVAEVRRKEQEEADRREADAAEARRKEREDEEARLETARRQRKDEEDKAAAARLDQKAAKADAREARSDARDAYSEGKDAGKTEKAAEAIAEKTDARADRLQRSADGATDADLTRLRGEHGTVGSLTARWTVAAIDHDVVPLEKLRGFFMADHVDAAIYRYMRANQGEWAGKEIVDTALEGVIFERIPETRIKG